MITKSSGDEPYNYPGLLPEECFQDLTQAWGPRVESSFFPELRKWNRLSRETNEARVLRIEHERDVRERRPEKEFQTFADRPP